MLEMVTNTLVLNLGTFDSRQIVNKQVASFSVGNLDETMKIPVENALVSKLLTTESESIITNEKIRHYSHMRDVEVVELDDKSVGVILSSKFARHLFGSEKRSQLR